MKKGNSGVLLVLLGAGALAFALGSKSRKMPPPGVQTKRPTGDQVQRGIAGTSLRGVTVTGPVGQAPPYPADESLEVLEEEEAANPTQLRRITMK